MYITYIHARPDGIPFYIGKGSSLSRMNRLCTRNKYHTNVTKKYGKENILKGYLECSTEQAAFLLEKGLIKCLKYKGVLLTNMTDGGEGSLGARHSEKFKSKMSKRFIGEKKSKQAIDNWRESRAGYTPSDKTRSKISNTLKGRSCPHLTKYVDKVEWINEDGSQRLATPAEMYAEFGGNFTRLIAGGRKSSKNWKLKHGRQI